MLNVLDDTLIPRGWQGRLPPWPFPVFWSACLSRCVPPTPIWGADAPGGLDTPGEQSDLKGEEAVLAPPSALFVAHGCRLLGDESCFVCSAVAQVLRQGAICNQRLDTLSFVFQTLVIKVSGVILSVVGGLAVGKVMEPEERCLGLSPSALHVLSELA